MKLLYDQNLSFRLCGLLGDLFPESAQVRAIGLDRATDREIWHFAAANEFTIATKDVDFANMAIHSGGPPKVVWLRCGNLSTADIAKLLREHALSILDLPRTPDKLILEILWIGGAESVR